jgi:hypothetical protein
MVDGPEEQICLYMPPNDTKETNTDPPILRRVVYRFRTDYDQRRAGGPIVWPSLEVTYSVMSRDQLETLDARARSIERAVNTMTIEEDGVSIWWWYGPDRREPPWLPEPTSKRTRERSVSLLSDPPVVVDFHDWEGYLVELNTAFDHTWEYLEDLVGNPATRADVAENYEIEPRTFARLLSRDTT